VPAPRRLLHCCGLRPPHPPAPTPDVLAAFRRPVWVYDLDAHRIVAASPSAAALWRAESPEALTARSLGPMSPAVQARLATYRQAFETEETITESWTLYPAGVPTTMVCLCSGVTTADGHSAMLVEAEPLAAPPPDDARLVEALRHDPAPVLLFALPGGALLLANPAAQTLLGERPTLESLLGEHAAVHELRLPLSRSDVISGETRIETLHGPRVAAWRAARGIDPVDGGDMVALTLLDVTQMRAAARSQLEGLSKAVAGTHDGIALTDAEGRFTFMNDAHMTMFGYTALEQVLGQPWTLLYDGAEVARFQTEVFTQLPGPGARWRGNAVGRRADGGIVRQEVSLTINHDGGIICMSRDIGARLDAEEQRRRLEIELAQAQKMETVGQFVGGLAHDLNNLLSAVLSTGRGMAMQAANADRVRQGAERIDRAGTQAARLIRRMLDFVRREEGPPVLVDLRAVLIRSTDLLRALLPKRIELVVEPGERVLRARIQEDRVVQVLLNLAANARDALDGREGRVRVRLSIAGDAAPERTGRGDHPTGEAAEIIFEDDGPGLPPDVMPRLFEAFYTTKPAGQGTGLGLSTSAQVLAEAGGRLEAWNTGGGAAFRLLLPTQAPAQVARLLLGHSDAELSDLVARVLEREGYAVESHVGPRAALDAALATPGAFRLLLAEGDASGLSGATVCETLDSAGLRLPVLLAMREPQTPPPVPARYRVLRTPFTTAALLSAVLDALAD
jgi:PAS domain S-box-containing protein